MLVRLIYCSRAAPGVDPEELHTILKTSRAHNARLGVTGVLCLADGFFIQVLEGGRSAVNQLYNRIVADGRHGDVTLLGYEDVRERRFAGWAMGQANMARLNPALLLKYSEKAALDPYALEGASVIALFDELVATGAIMCGS
ncbi:MAG: BLUF domain-containing protein [Pseudomonadota bacterium]